MSPAEFVAQHEAEWIHLEKWLTNRGRPPASAPESAAHLEFPELYRRICRHLALATERRYPQDIIDRLNTLALSGQHVLYPPETRLWHTIATFLSGGFAAHVRRHARIFWLAMAVFYIPFLGSTIATWQAPYLAYSVISPEDAANYEQMYDHNHKVIGYDRGEDSNLQMFGFYIGNNIGIGFQTFAGGVFAGIGSLLVLLYNGVTIGAVSGFLTARGHGDMFWQFVCGHSAFELNAIALCGMAGLMLGRALIAPGVYRRGHALTLAARDAVPILYGAAFMLFVAAIIEAFWSSRTAIPLGLKYAMAVSWWLSVVMYFLFAGRTQSTANKMPSGDSHAS